MKIEMNELKQALEGENREFIMKTVLQLPLDNLKKFALYSALRLADQASFSSMCKSILEILNGNTSELSKLVEKLPENYKKLLLNYVNQNKIE